MITNKSYINSIGQLRSILNQLILKLTEQQKFIVTLDQMDQNNDNKREHEEGGEKEPPAKTRRVCNVPIESRFSNMEHGRGKLIPKHIFDKLTPDDIKMIESVKTSCADVKLIKQAIELRRKHRLSIKLPEDLDDATYYIEDGLRKVYPYQYLYQSFAKRRWMGRKLRDILGKEFRDISEEQLKRRFDEQRILINGNPIKWDYVIKSNDFVAHRSHRHELAVLATPIKVIHEDKDTLVVDKPPSMPIHACGRYRHNSVMHILQKEYGYSNLKVVHRLDRLVSGVLITAKHSGRAHQLEELIKNRNVQKEYVCRVVGKFPMGNPEDDGFITVDQPLELVEGKIGFAIVHPEGKESTTKFKLLNYNGKTSAVLCKPLTGRMHQIRVHLQYLGHPIVNDTLYNNECFGSERGKGGKYDKTMRQLSMDILDQHRACSWLVVGDDDLIDLSEVPHEQVPKSLPENAEVTAKFLSQEEREETMSALGHFFTNESWKDMEQKWKFQEEKYIKDPDCRDCATKYHDPPLRNLYLYLHAYRYAGLGWCYESEMPVWARDGWKY